MIELRSEIEIDRIRNAGMIVREVLNVLSNNAKCGVSTYKLDKLAEKLILARGAKPAFKGYKGYPSTICTSVNNAIVHEIPSKKKVLHESDIVSFDVGVFLEGFYADAAITVGVGKISQDAENLIRITGESLSKGLENCIEGRRLSDISRAIQLHIENNGFSVVRHFVGHGIGRKLHEPPEIPNFVADCPGPILKSGMVFAIEPMVNAGSYQVTILSDGWTAVTRDGSLSAHFEDTVVVRKDNVEILT